MATGFWRLIWCRCETTRCTFNVIVAYAQVPEGPYWCPFCTNGAHWLARRGENGMFPNNNNPAAQAKRERLMGQPMKPIYRALRNQPPGPKRIKLVRDSAGGVLARGPRPATFLDRS